MVIGMKTHIYKKKPKIVQQTKMMQQKSFKNLKKLSRTRKVI